MAINLILFQSQKKTKFIAQSYKKIMIMALLYFVQQISKLNKGKLYAYEFKL